MLSKANVDYYKMKKDKWEYYTGKAPQHVYAEKPFNLKILKTDIDKYMDADPELVKLKQKVEYIHLYCNQLVFEQSVECHCFQL